MAEFIAEDPAAPQPAKRRARLVISCDYCRLKRVRCVQSPNTPKCKLCTDANVPCSFHDRDRYYAERQKNKAAKAAGSSTGMTTPSPGNSSSPANSSPTESSRPAAPPPPIVLPSTGVNVALYGLPTPISANTNPEQHAQSFPLISPPLISPPILPNLPSLSPQRTPLLSPTDPRQPHPSLMPHFIEAFFRRTPPPPHTFLNYDDIVMQFFYSTLPPLLANCIAALSVPFTEATELDGWDLQFAAEHYATNAKNLLAFTGDTPNIDTLQGLICVSWMESRMDRIPEFRAYARRAIDMALRLGLADASGRLALSASAQRQHELDGLWACVVQLDQALASVEQRR